MTKKNKISLALNLTLTIIHQVDLVPMNSGSSRVVMNFMMLKIVVMMKTQRMSQQKSNKWSQSTTNSIFGSQHLSMI